MSVISIGSNYQRSVICFLAWIAVIFAAVAYSGPRGRNICNAAGCEGEIEAKIEFGLLSSLSESRT
jgi:hypothetical protein